MLTVGDYSRLQESGPVKRGDEDVGEHSNVDEYDRRDDGATEREWQRGSLSDFFHHGLPLDGERFSPLVLHHHGSQRGGSPSKIGSLLFVSLFSGNVFRLNTVSFIGGDP